MDGSCAAAALFLRLLLLWTQGREQDDVADGVAVGEQHHQTVDTDTLTGSRRQTVFQRGHEVGVVEHGFVIACGFLVNLSLEAFGLIFRIVQLGEAVGQLAYRR